MVLVCQSLQDHLDLLYLLVVPCFLFDLVLLSLLKLPEDQDYQEHPTEIARGEVISGVVQRM